MDKSVLWSLRLGFTGKQSRVIHKLGFEKFLTKSFDSKFDTKLPPCLKGSPTTLEGFNSLRKKRKLLSKVEQKAFRRKEREAFLDLKKWWIAKMKTNEFPLREKMVCFWHNHFVASQNKVKVNYWIYQHNQILRENAFGNFRELTKIILRSNAMIKYLDNDDNKVGKINENLSRELLELFTLGIGNYTEQDIKNGAKGLAGLTMGDEGGWYKKIRLDNDNIEYFGERGIFKVDALVDIIFKQPAAPYLITKKILQWFIYDNPEESLVKKYGDYLRKVDFEIQPFLETIFIEEFEKSNAGSKIKDPLTFGLQLLDIFPEHQIDNQQIAQFLKKQGMELFNQPNVKGWDGGRSWLTSQIYLQRNNVVELLSQGRSMEKMIRGGGMHLAKDERPINASIFWNANSSAESIIKSFTDQLLFQVDENMENDLINIISHDFDTTAENADEVILRLVNFICKSPEFQLI